MRQMKTAFQLCAVMLFAAVVLSPHSGKIQGKLNRTAPGANGRPVMIADGPEPVPRLPQPLPPKK